ncbi:hypothetical protein EN802_13875 [bacterium M00.F.Ca.ET.159.01.1.1]|nr:hypothetical protein EN802_13875 [bacterium M00.F.Ca.ET.159.01.1.1]
MASTIKKVSEWSAKRSTNSITITGKDPKGNEIKITGVPVIEAGRKGRGPIVVDRLGARFELV